MSRGVRLRAAAALVALYSFCLLVPSVALAWGNGNGIAHRLMQNHAVGMTSHVHADGTVHVHGNATGQQDLDSSADQHGQTGSCCGIACVPAIAPNVQVDLADPLRFTTVLSLIAEGAPGRAPDRLYRPPISL